MPIPYRRLIGLISYPTHTYNIHSILSREVVIFPVCMKKSSVILIIGMLVLLAGAVMSVMKIEPYADYVLIAGALIVFARGFVRTHEKDDEHPNS